MNAWHTGWLWLVGLLLAGCQNNGNYDLMERELRLQEDRIYQLEDELDRQCQLLANCQGENKSLQSSQDGGSTRLRLSAPTVTPSTTSPADIPSTLTPPQLELDLPAAPGPTLPGAAVPDNAPAPASPAMPAPRALEEPPRALEDEAAPPPRPAELPTPRSVLERGEQTERDVPARLPAGTADERGRSHARRPSWSPHR